jgi:hypothetical protein
MARWVVRLNLVGIRVISVSIAKLFGGIDDVQVIGFHPPSYWV